MYITKKELDSLNAIIDYVSSSTDGVDDTEYWEALHSDLYSIWEKGKKEHQSIKNKRLFKRALNIARKKTETIAK